MDVFTAADNPTLGIVIGLGHSVMAMSGEETLAQVYRGTMRSMAEMLREISSDERISSVNSASIRLVLRLRIVLQQEFFYRSSLRSRTAEVSSSLLS
jgi:hypothetical protein